MNAGLKNICCVCSGSGEHDIFGRIPVNAHAKPNEFLHWRKTIAELIADVSGVFIFKDDKNLAHKICTVCISYMKHAILFRNQVISNTRWLQQQTNASLNHNFGAGVLGSTPKQIQHDNIINSFDELWNDANIAPESETLDYIKMEIDLAFGGECDDSTEEDDDNDPNASILFNYKEKSFKEDDISNFNSMSSIIITVPDEMRERKCDACRKRFMLKESFEQHLKECIELKLLKFITDGNQLLMMRKSRAISANEFVRRMIYALKKMVKSLASCYKEVSDGPLPVSIDDKLEKKLTLIEMADQKHAEFQNFKKSDANGHGPHISEIKLLNGSDVYDVSEAEQTKPLLKSLEGKSNIFIQKNHLNSIISSNSGMPHADGSSAASNQHLNIAVNIEEILSLPLDVKLVKNGIRSSNAYNCIELESNIRTNEFTAKASASGNGGVKRPPSETVIAQCSPCSESFSSLQQFEEHMRQFHNIPSSSSRSTSSQSPPANIAQSHSPVANSSSATLTNDSLNNDERNILLQMLASSSLKF